MLCEHNDSNTSSLVTPASKLRNKKRERKIKLSTLGDDARWRSESSNMLESRGSSLLLALDGIQHKKPKRGSLESIDSHNTGRWERLSSGEMPPPLPPRVGESPDDGTEPAYDVGLEEPVYDVPVEQQQEQQQQQQEEALYHYSEEIKSDDVTQKDLNQLSFDFWLDDDCDSSSYRRASEEEFLEVDDVVTVNEKFDWQKVGNTYFHEETGEQHIYEAGEEPLYDNDGVPPSDVSAVQVPEEKIYDVANFPSTTASLVSSNQVMKYRGLRTINSGTSLLYDDFSVHSSTVMSTVEEGDEEDLSEDGSDDSMSTAIELWAQKKYLTALHNGIPANKGAREHMPGIPKLPPTFFHGAIGRKEVRLSMVAAITH